MNHNSDGSADTAFGSHGTESISLAGTADYQNIFGVTLLQETDGSLLLAAAVSSTDSSQYALVNHYSAAGQLDTTFGTNGSATVGANVQVEFATYTVTSVGATAALAGDGSVLLTGGTGPVGANIFAVQTSGSETPGAGTKLVFVNEPTDPSGGTLNPIVVAVEDANGALASMDASMVTLTLSGGPTGATLTGSAAADTQTVMGGLVTFSGGYDSVYDLEPGTGYTLTASSGTDTAATSNAFNETEPQLVFITQPADALTTGTPGPVSVEIEDGSGNIVATDDSTVSVALAGGTAGATLGGTLQVTAVDGVATFSDLTLTTAGANYTLNAADGVYTSAASNPFTMTTPSPEALTLGNVVLPATSITTTKLNARVPVVITNTAGKMRWKLTVDVFADTGTRLDGSQVLLRSISPTESLKTGTRKAFDFTIKSLPATLATGTYHLLVEVVDPVGGTELVATSQTIAVTAAVVQPVVSVASVTPGNISVGKLGYVWVTLSNEGNVVARGVDFTLGLSSDGISPVTGITLDTARARGTVIAAGGTRRFRLVFRITRAIPTGAFFPDVSASLAGVSVTSVGTTSFMAG